MHNSSIGVKNKYVPCKYMYHLLLLVFHANEADDGFIHNNTYMKPGWIATLLSSFVDLVCGA